MDDKRLGTESGYDETVDIEFSNCGEPLELPPTDPEAGDHGPQHKKNLVMGNLEEGVGAPRTSKPTKGDPFAGMGKF